MCLAILKPGGVEIPFEHLRNGWIGNPDGGGYGFVDKEGKLVARKGFMKLADFGEAIKTDLAQYKDSPFLIHFRIRSMGDKSEENTHPFEIDGGLLIHNGTLSGTRAVYGTGKSDTALFAERYKSNLSFDFVSKHKTELNSALDYNKVAILYANKRYQIINEAVGSWDKDVWYSNKSYTPRPSGLNRIEYDYDWE